MRRIIISLLVIVPFLAMSCGAGDSSSSNASQTKDQKSGTFKNVSVTDLNTAMSDESDIIILDVRTPGELTGGYVDGAKNIDINNSNFKTEAANLDKSKTVYVYCRSGHRSQNASKVLISMGFTDVRNVEGGFIAWSQKGYKSVK
jgi:rhodanese-related sulfurtransferase